MAYKDEGPWKGVWCEAYLKEVGGKDLGAYDFYDVAMTSLNDCAVPSLSTSYCSIFVNLAQHGLGVDDNF